MARQNVAGGGLGWTIGEKIVGRLIRTESRKVEGKSVKCIALATESGETIKTAATVLATALEEGGIKAGNVYEIAATEKKGKGKHAYLDFAVVLLTGTDIPKRLRK